MPKGSFKNTYEICGDVTKVFSKKRGGEVITTLIDTEDLELLKQINITWHSQWDEKLKSYYFYASKYLGRIEGTKKYKYKTLVLHKEIMKAHGEEGNHVDHIDHDSLNNRKENLRITSFDTNATNRKSKNSNNKSGYRNVSWDKKIKKWVVQLQINGKNTRLKYFDYEDLDEAGAYAEKMRNEIYGDFAGKN